MRQLKPHRHVIDKHFGSDKRAKRLSDRMAPTPLHRRICVWRPLSARCQGGGAVAGEGSLERGGATTPGEAPPPPHLGEESLLPR